MLDALGLSVLICKMGIIKYFSPRETASISEVTPVSDSYWCPEPGEYHGSSQ